MNKQKREKIDSYLLQNMTKDKMIEFIERANKTGTEYGFKLCYDNRDKIIKSGTPCKGKECSLDIEKSECKDNEKPIGIFHTRGHKFTPSVQDLRDIHSNPISCIGTSQEIKCFKRKKENFDSSEDDEIRSLENQEKLVQLAHRLFSSNEITHTGYFEKEKKYRKELDRLVNSYFDIIKIKK
jgi:hypothetical protein